MSKAAYIIFFLLVIAAIVVVLTGLPQSLVAPSAPAPIPIQNPVDQITTDQTVIPENLDFGVVIKKIPYSGVAWEDTRSNGNIPVNVTQTIHFQLARGINVDSTGNASSWVFIVRQPQNISQETFSRIDETDTISLVTFDFQGYTSNVWPGDYPNNEIAIDTIISPRDLFSKNREVIIPQGGVNSTESRELALVENTYYLTITGGEKTRNLVFDAKTGALTSSND